MVFLRKILVFSAKLIIGVYSLYLFLIFIFIPFGLPWVLSSQGSRILKHPVKIGSIFLNPFLLRLDVHGFEILDSQKQVLIGFDKFWVDFSFIGLLQKKIRIESIGLSSPELNLQLLENGKINLLALVPQNLTEPQLSAEAKQKSEAVSVLADQPQPLAAVVVDLISLDSGKISFTDKSVQPNFTTVLSAINLRITGLSTRADAQANISFQAKLDERGTISAETSLKAFALPMSLETTFKLNDYFLQVLTPYVGKYTGHAVKDGKLSLTLNYRVADNQLNAAHKLLVQSFDFGDKVESPDALKLPFGLALALLEDSQDRIDISLPVTGDMSKPEFHYFHLIGQVLRNFLFKIVTKPFAFLGSVVGAEGSSEDLGSIYFTPGRLDLSETEKGKLNIIIKALLDRPKLVLKINGCYDPDADWKAIKAEVLDKDFRELRQESKRLEDWVYQELYQRRFGIRALWKLTKFYQSQSGEYESEKLNTEIKRQLIADGSPNKTALDALALGRAQALYDFIVTAGLDAGKVSLGDIREVESNAGVVPLELVLTVFDNSL